MKYMLILTSDPADEPAPDSEAFGPYIGKRIVTDGPFIESKEVIGGYYVIDVADLDEALDWAARIPNSTFGTIEVRPVMSWDD